MANLESYTMTTWENGQVITAAPLNKIEKAIGDVTNAVLGMATTISSNDLKAAKITVGEITGGTNTTLKVQGPVQANSKISIGYIIDGDTDAASKKYVDDTITGAISGYNVKSINASNGLTADTTNGTTTISLKTGANLIIGDDGTLNATYPAATQSAAGLMSGADKTKLDGISSGATNNVGTVTGVMINNSTKSPNSGVVNIGNIVTGITINNAQASVNSDGVVDLGTVIREQDISTKVNSDNPVFTGEITLGDTSINEQQLQALLNLINNGGEQQ